MLIPAIVLFVTVPVTLIVVGPIVSALSNGIGSVVSGLWRMAPALGGLVMGGFWQVLVMTGLHTGMTPFIIEMLMQNGCDILGICVTSSMFALAGVAFACFTATRDSNRKQTSISAMISALLGVTEPAIYGIALPFDKAFLSAIAGGGIAGAIGAVLGVKIYGFGGNALLQLPFTFAEGQGLTNTLLWAVTVAVAFILSFVLARVLCRKTFAKEG